MKKRSVLGRSRFLLLVALLLAMGSLVEAKPSYIQGRCETIEILSAASEGKTRRLIYEMLELREELIGIVGAKVAPKPAIQLVILPASVEFKDLLPNSREKQDSNWTTTSIFRPTEGGITVALIDGGSYEASKQVVLFFYANYLLASMAPNAPLWVSDGLTDYISAVAHKGATVVWGEGVRDYSTRLSPGKIFSFTVLADDQAMSKHINGSNRSTPLYPESWALWHWWLTHPTAENRAGVRALFSRIRQGLSVTASDVVVGFNSTVEKLDQERKDQIRKLKYASIAVPARFDETRNPIIFSKADEAACHMAFAMMFSRAGTDYSTYAPEILATASAYPDLPRPPEALALLATVRHDEGEAEHYWERAREAKSTNPYAYRSFVQGRLDSQQFPLSLRAEYSEAYAATLREALDACLALNPGEMRAYFLLAWVEALAPTPRLEKLNAILESEAHVLNPALRLPLAIAFQHIQQSEVATKLLNEMLRDGRISPGYRVSAEQVLKKLDVDKASTTQASSP